MALIAMAESCALARAEGYAVPRVDGITVDGSADDWGDRGFRLDLLTPMSQPERSLDVFDARARLGWDDDGLVVLVVVHDVTPHASDYPTMLYLGDSVEIFVGDSLTSSNRLQLALARGTDSSGAPRQFFDSRPAGSPPLEAETACRSTSDGYVAEARIPWKNLGGARKMGDTCAFNIYVNDADLNGARAQRAWFNSPLSSHDPSAAYLIRLSDKADAPVDTIASAGVEHFRRVAVTVQSRRALGNSKIVVRDGRREVPGAMRAQSVSDNMAVVDLPMPAYGTTYGPLTVEVDGVRLPPVAIPDVTQQRLSAFQSAQFGFAAPAFSGAELPGADFVEPNLVEDAVGPYTVQTTYYDADYHVVTSAAQVGRYGAVSRITTESGLSRVVDSTLYRLPDSFKAKDLNSLLVTVSLPASLGIDPVIASERTAETVGSLRREIQNQTLKSQDFAVLLAGLQSAHAGDPVVQRTSPQGRDQEWWAGLDRTIGQGGYPYFVYQPKGYDADAAKQWPLIVFLHGSGERGSDLDIVRGVTTDYGLKDEAAGRFLVAVLQCPTGSGWNPWLVEQVVDDVGSKYRVDQDRIYLTGISMGGFGTYNTAMVFPNRFAAIAPMSGIGDNADVARIKDVPVWTFHGDSDPTVSFLKDKATVDAINAAGGRIRFTVFPGMGHDIWHKAYREDAFYDWLLAQQLGKPQQAPGLEIVPPTGG